MKHPKVIELLPKRMVTAERPLYMLPQNTDFPCCTPYTNRFVMIGNASISRTYKNGIESAFDAAHLAAHTIFRRGFSEEDFKEGYYKSALKLLAQDNFFGNLMFGIHDYTTSPKGIGKCKLTTLQNGKTPGESVQINSILWNMVTDNASYKDFSR